MSAPMEERIMLHSRRCALALAVALAGTSLVAYLETRTQEGTGASISMTPPGKGRVVQDQSLDGLQIDVET
jgi:hypothetical protein